MKLDPRLESIVEAWAPCTKCNIGTLAFRKAFVDYIGDVFTELPSGKVDILLVGEGPGRGEDAMGRPFVGPAGKLLRLAFEDAGLCDTPLLVGITNLVLCRPCDARSAPNRAPLSLEIANCKPRLAAMIEVMQPNVVVALGRVPFDNLDTELISQVQYPKRVLSHMYHPSYILRCGGKASAAYPAYVSAIREVLKLALQWRTWNAG